MIGAAKVHVVAAAPPWAMQLYLVNSVITMHADKYKSHAAIMATTGINSVRSGGSLTMHDF